MLRYFISDLHLQQQRPDITQALLFFLEQIATDADEIYLLGDIFEAWIGDDYADPVLDQIVPAFLKRKQDGTSIYFAHGNRDFLVRQPGASKLGAQLIHTPYRLNLPQGEAVLLHGDELCLDDLEYQAFRQQVRAESWQTDFLAKPLEERLAIARQLRETSRAAGAMKRDEIMDVSQSAVDDLFTQSGADLIIHGHTHRPDRHRSAGGERIVLGDWGETGWYLVSSNEQLELVEFKPC